MSKKVILSTDNTEEYLALLPLVTFSWVKIGYTPIILYVNVSTGNLAALKKHCINSEFIEVQPIDGVKDSTVAQLSRLFQGYDSDDILVSSDADMVIAKNIFAPTVTDDQIFSYGFDLTGKSELPICYVQSTARKWKDMIGEWVTPQSAFSTDWNLYWSTDQQLLTQRAHEYGMDRITFVDRGNQGYRGLPTGRWDRFAWDQVPADIIDVHMKRNSWEAQIQVFQRLWPEEDYSFINKFREALCQDGNNV